MTEPKMKELRVMLPEKLHDKLKSRAKNEASTMATYVRRLICDGLSDKNGKYSYGFVEIDGTPTYIRVKAPDHFWSEN